MLELAKQLDKASKACHLMNYSRDSFYRVKELEQTGGEVALQQGANDQHQQVRTIPQLASDASVGGMTADEAETAQDPGGDWGPRRPGS